MDRLNDGFSSANSSPEANSTMKVANESDRDTDRLCQHAEIFSFRPERVWCFRIMFSKGGTELRQSRLRPCGVTPVWP
jgi:hypothetical protein